jgi:hypothetical protein
MKQDKSFVPSVIVHHYSLLLLLVLVSLLLLQRVDQLLRPIRSRLHDPQTLLDLLEPSRHLAELLGSELGEDGGGLGGDVELGAVGVEGHGREGERIGKGEGKAEEGVDEGL